MKRNNGNGVNFFIKSGSIIILGAFNLIPIPPLDGSKILMSVLPENGQRSLAHLEPYGFFVLIFLLFTGLLNPVVDFMQGVIYALISLFLGPGR